MIREVDLVSYLPLFMGEYREIRAALEAEDPEFGLIWEASDRVLKNMFMETADGYGVSRMEKILGIVPSAKDTLEHRKAAILMRYNLRPPYTLSMLRHMLAAVVGDGNFLVECLHERYEIRMYLMEQETGLIRRAYETVIPICPANMVLCAYGRYGGSGAVSAGSGARVRFRMVFYPQNNVPRLFLDRTWKLDQEQLLNGYHSRERAELYPVCVRFGSEVREVLEDPVRMGVRAGIEERTENGTFFSARMEAEWKGASKEGCRVRTSAACAAEAGGIMVQNQNYLDGVWKLGGGRRLNGGREQF